MRKIFAAPLTIAALSLAALTGTASAQSLRAPSAMPEAAYSAYAAPDVARTGAITRRADVTGPVVVRDGAVPLADTLHLFGARTDATPF